VCVLLAIAVVAVSGCDQNEHRDAAADPAADDSSAYLGPAARAGMARMQGDATPDPGVLVTPRGGGTGRPFRAIGRLALSGKPPFAQPILILDDGSVYQLTGPRRGACIHRQGQRCDLSGTVIGTSSSPGIRGVVRVTEMREVRR
jgi:hypothetical protein